MINDYIMSIHLAHGIYVCLTFTQTAVSCLKHDWETYVQLFVEHIKHDLFRMKRIQFSKTSAFLEEWLSSSHFLTKKEEKKTDIFNFAM